MSTEAILAGEYSERGEYHRALDKNWIYYPVYVEKMRRVRRFLADHKNSKILDLGCGEGVLVAEFRAQGYNITGVDLHYKSDHVVQASITDTRLPAESFDVILCLDVIEHLGIADQDQALSEIHRLLKPGGVFYATIPNLAHLASRLSFLVLGKLIRTAEIHRHIGDRPYGEFKKLIAEKFDLKHTFGIFPSFPILSVLTYLSPGKSLFLHRIYNALLAWTSFCFLCFFIAEKPRTKMTH